MFKFKFILIEISRADMFKNGKKVTDKVVVQL